jgi:sugar phosphate isomerase/epimerase
MNKLGISNLAFAETGADDQLSSLYGLGFKGVEVAPTRIAPWADLSDDRLQDYRDSLAEHGLSIPSLQAIMFGVDGVALLGEVDDFTRMTAHFRTVSAIGHTLGAKVAVFGAPKQRSKGGLSDADAFDLGSTRLLELARIAYEHGMSIGLEAVPSAYGCDFLLSWQEVKRMVQAVDHPGLKVHLDVSCVELGGGDIAEAIRACAGQTVHFHAAEPQLRSFTSAVAGHEKASAALAETGYDGWVVVEMLEDAAAGKASLAVTANFVQSVYGSADLRNQFPPV